MSEPTDPIIPPLPEFVTLACNFVVQQVDQGVSLRSAVAYAVSSAVKEAEKEDREAIAKLREAANKAISAVYRADPPSESRLGNALEELEDAMNQTAHYVSASPKDNNEPNYTN